ncbi:NACHT domain-containing protein [Kordia sp.]|uniref:NACHT domain-containing protein n=1 Tax=Kordia sp. TaxID=1965332 RepID=UPI003B5BCF65
MEPISFTLIITYVSKKFLDQLIKEQGYSKLRKFFFPSKKYETRLIKVFNNSVKEFKVKKSIVEKEGKIAFYASKVLFDKLNRYVLFNNIDYDLNSIDEEIKKDTRIIKPTKEELELFYKIFTTKIKSDKLLKKLFVEENYKRKIFSLGTILNRIEGKVDSIGSKVDDMYGVLIPSKKKKIKSDLNKEDFIEKITLKEGLIERKFYNEQNQKAKGLSYSFNESENDIGIKELIERENKIVILGNPGSGKTTELERLAINVWNDNANKFIPIYRNLKSFTNQDTISSYLIIDYNSLEKVLFIFDGVDEIRDIQDFKSKLNTFISHLEITKIKFKILVSCRTNIYESILNSISDFKTYYLRDLTTHEGQHLFKLKSKYKNNLLLNKEFRDFFNNPFFVDIVSSYFNTKGRMPTNTADLWENYIDKRLSLDKDNKLVKSSINIHLIKAYSKKISLVNELMQINFFKEEDVFKLVEENDVGFRNFFKNPLIYKEKGRLIWSFEHKNIQEFFAALAISKKDFKDIIEFIQIKGTGRTHPSLFNTITLLINLLNSESHQYKKLVNWFVKNESELLFRADANRISTDVKEQVFQSYFQKECIEKTLWIDTNKTYELYKVGRFSDCEVNYEYLVKIFQNKKYHFRARYSALEVLTFFSIPSEELLNLKKELLNLIRDVSNLPQIKAQIVRLIQSQPKLKNDSDLIKEAFEIFKTETNKEINTALLSLVGSFENIEKFADYIKEEFLRAHDIKNRKEVDEVGRGNEYKSKRLILRLESSSDFLETVKYFFNEEISLSYDEDFLKKLVKRCIHFSLQEEDFIIKLLSMIKDEIKFYGNRKLLKNIIQGSNSELKSLQYLFENIEFKKIIFFTSYLVNLSNVDEVADLILEKDFDTKSIEFFRNQLGDYNHDNREVAEIFDSLMRDKGITFQKDVYSNEKRELDKLKNLKKIQNELDILLYREELLKKIELIFDAYKGTITLSNLREIRDKWYEEHSFGDLFLDSSLSIIDSSLQQRGSLVTLSEAIEDIEEETIVILESKKLVERYQWADWKFNMSKHEEKIKQWCIKTSNTINFDSIVKFQNKSAFYFIGNNYKKIELIFFFQDLLQFNLSKDFLLNCIEIFEFDSSHDVDDNYEKLKELINDEESFNNRIVDNILNKEMFAFSLSRHIEYALNNNLHKSFPKIREYLKEKGSSHDGIEKIKKYVELTSDNDFLLECCKNSESYLHWELIDVLVKKDIHIDFCLEKSLEYLGNEDDRFNEYAIGVLFKLNHIRGIEYLVEFAEKGKAISVRMINSMNYDVFSEYEIIERLFDIIYNQKIDRFEFSDYSTLFRNYLYNLSIDEDKYKQIIKNLEKIKDSESDLFHISRLIDDVKDNYFNSKSKPLSFEEALSKIKELSI